MAVIETLDNLQIHRLPQPKYIDAIRCLTPLSVFNKFIVLATHDTSTSSSSIEIQSLATPNHHPSQTLHLQSTFTPPSRISSLKVSQTPHKLIIASSTFEGSLHLLFVNPVNVSIESELNLREKGFHNGPIAGIDLVSNGLDCVCVGEHGTVNLVSVGESKLSYRRVLDSRGLMSYTAVKWASPTEFATGGLGFSLQWWDQRKPRGVVSQFKGGWQEAL